MTTPKHTVCNDCPWRIDAPRAYWDKQHFDDIWQNCQDDGVHVMMCHKSKPEKMIYCAGHIRVVGFDSIGIRLAHFSGKIDGNQCGIGGDGLFSDFAKMMRAQGFHKKLPPRNKVTQLSLRKLRNVRKSPARRKPQTDESAG